MKVAVQPIGFVFTTFGFVRYTRDQYVLLFDGRHARTPRMVRVVGQRVVVDADGNARDFGMRDIAIGGKPMD